MPEISGLGLMHGDGGMTVGAVRRGFELSSLDAGITLGMSAPVTGHRWCFVYVTVTASNEYLPNGMISPSLFHLLYQYSPVTRHRVKK